MKTIYLLLIIVTTSCFNKKAILRNENCYYFYFQDNDSTMNSFYDPEKQIKTYWYDVQSADNIVFRVQKEEDTLKVKELEAKDTIGLNIKEYNWFNQFDNTSRYKFFNLKPAKQFYIVEKRPDHNHLYLSKVEFIEEIE